MAEAIRAQISCLEGFEEHWKVAANKDHAGGKTREHGKLMTVHNGKQPFSDASQSVS